MRLKKNVVSVDFHVGQYAKIVEGMKRELDEWKAKAGALAEENGRLKEELHQRRQQGAKHELEDMEEEEPALEQKQVGTVIIMN